MKDSTKDKWIAIAPFIVLFIMCGFSNAVFIAFNFPTIYFILSLIGILLFAIIIYGMLRSLDNWDIK